ncbi:uncharacterized protein [Aegilops tauschii subsp. strangulata]|uniref:uncharacterized protein n=1 Tax=Aegilops tauschii subsp. strangulata TaxID=200361 RepID=UPI00098B8755|nr:ethylene-responsive transcription factor ERF054-like [Aegilops tauschii subsp. strangulata]
MPPRPRSSSGYRGVRLRSSGVYYAEIRSGDTRLVLGTFDNAHEAARAYDTAAWHLGRPRSQMNFFDTRTRQQAHDLRKRERRLHIAEADEHTMAVWRERSPLDVAAENEFWAQRRAERAVRRADKRARKELAEAQLDNPASTWDSEDPRWLDAFTSSDYTTEEDEE